MFRGLDPSLSKIAFDWPKWLLRFAWLVATCYLMWLAVVTFLRVSFPWDLNNWSESPFLTNMLKLDNGQPIYSSPADANSFVYSPGLEYLTFAVLKPLGWQLDIRFCRALSVLFGIFTGIAVGGVFVLALRALVGDDYPRGFVWLGAVIAVLVVFRNFTSDTVHPDNLVMLHTAFLFLLTLAALHSKSFGLAVTSILWAALGLFAKQILFFAFVGPLVLFAWTNPWGWRKWWGLAGVGVLASIGALSCLWLTPWARFYTVETLSRQGLHLAQLYWGVMELLSADRAILAVLGVAALSILWRAGSTGRRYLTVWLVIGAFSVCPNILSYIKMMGTWNNLIVLQLWLFLLVWPAVALWLRELAPSGSAIAEGEYRFHFLLASLLVLFLLMLFPRQWPPDRSMYACCTAVQERVTRDLRDGRKVLVAHGTTYQIKAGVKDVPLDRANSVLELKMAGLGGLPGTIDRIHGRYYQRIYLTVGEWYGDAIISEIKASYTTDSVIKRPQITDRLEVGRALYLLGDCQILSPRSLAPQAETGSSTHHHSGSSSN